MIQSMTVCLRVTSMTGVCEAQTRIAPDDMGRKEMMQEV